MISISEFNISKMKIEVERCRSIFVQ